MHHFQENSSGSVIINNNITVSEIEEPLNLIGAATTSMIDDENAALTDQKHSIGIPHTMTVDHHSHSTNSGLKKKLINDPHLLRTRLMNHNTPHNVKRSINHVRFTHTPATTIQRDCETSSYRSQSEGHRLI